MQLIHGLAFEVQYQRAAGFGSLAGYRIV